MYPNAPSTSATKITGAAARPSMPSVRFTEFDVAIMKKTARSA